MNETIAIIVSALAGAVSLTTLISWLANRANLRKQEGAAEARTTASLDTIKLQNENLLSGNREICAKLDDQNIRLVRLEQTVDNANLSEIPLQIATISESVKTAHKRIDKLERKGAKEHE